MASASHVQDRFTSLLGDDRGVPRKAPPGSRGMSVRQLIGSGARTVIAPGVGLDAACWLAVERDGARQPTAMLTSAPSDIGALQARLVALNNDWYPDHVSVDAAGGLPGGLAEAAKLNAARADMCIVDMGQAEVGAERLERLLSAAGRHFRQVVLVAKTSSRDTDGLVDKRFDFSHNKDLSTWLRSKRR